ncbi:rare lipoprotein A precursor [Vibrio ishigakensis]|uniref:Endolytic peptidoglycan transglycosylase RlpA n=1 Tax=Vibrio ishigakensis TaxID=1481914 RepID=A0A0B8NIS2_9VIBR|nr:septal ring lytic transglycosylase RlpA family protein [Vibrio ishigakensis]GAM54610.1 rare lipoprotein A precursor [Vibrio ishigakensis]GAM69969.1 rare lipoprotein A precursor [Vibrio sp. JCM 19236]
MEKRSFLLAGLFALLLAGCSSSDSERYAINQDIPPDAPITLDHIEDATPRYEPYSLGGNKDYTVLGKSYSVIDNPQGFKQKGKASWYGKKFHGHLTSNGETYDMYSMSAAHKTLPIPSYVKVTNLDNGKTAVVRVNDRGPFHDGRIIDLSYAAATKLGVIQSGVANVEIEHIDTSAHKKPKTSSHPKFIIQVASLSNAENSQKLADKLSKDYQQPSFVESKDKTNRIFVGPISEANTAQDVLKKLKQDGFTSAFIKKHKVQ